MQPKIKNKKWLKNVIARIKWSINKQNTKYLNSKNRIFKFYFIWTHIMRCLLDFKTFDTFSTFFLRVEFAGHSNGVALLYSTHFPKTSMFLCQKYQYLFYLNDYCEHFEMWCLIWNQSNYYEDLPPNPRPQKITLAMMVVVQRATLV